MEVTDLCGSPSAVALWDAFYRYLTEEQGFAARPALGVGDALHDVGL